MESPLQRRRNPSPLRLRRRRRDVLPKPRRQRPPQLLSRQHSPRPLLQVAALHSQREDGPAPLLLAQRLRRRCCRPKAMLLQRPRRNTRRKIPEREKMRWWCWLSGFRESSAKFLGPLRRLLRSSESEEQRGMRRRRAIGCFLKEKTAAVKQEKNAIPKETSTAESAASPAGRSVHSDLERPLFHCSPEQQQSLKRELSWRLGRPRETKC